MNGYDFSFDHMTGENREWNKDQTTLQTLFYIIIIIFDTNVTINTSITAIITNISNNNAISSYCVIVRVSVVLKRTVVGD